MITITTVTFDDAEMVALEAAIGEYLAKCRREVVAGAKAPFWAHAHTLADVSQRLFPTAAERR